MSISSTPVRYVWKNGMPVKPEKLVAVWPKPMLIEPEWITCLSWVFCWTACLGLVIVLLSGCGADSDDSPSSPVAPRPGTYNPRSLPDAGSQEVVIPWCPGTEAPSPSTCQTLVYRRDFGFCNRYLPCSASIS